MEKQNIIVEAVQQEDKTVKNFEATMKRLVAIVGGEEQLFPKKKIKSDTLATIVSGLVKEKKEKLEKEVTADLISLLDKHVELKKAIAEKKAELKKLEETKMKEFSEAASKIFGKIEDVGNIEKSYYDSLKSVGTDTAETKV